MKNSFKVSSWVAASLLAASVMPMHASPDDALIDALVQKGVISSREAAEIRDKAMQDVSTPDSSKLIHFGDAIKNLTFYGDVRLRAELRDGKIGAGEVNAGTGTIYTAGGSEDRDRLRYRVRMGINADLYDNFFFGIGVATNVTNPKSGNVTFGNSDSAGPFGKASGLLAINKVFLGWRPTDYLTMEVGQFDNPFYCTNLTWDNNITPVGFNEQLQKDFCNVNLFANAGQLLYNSPSFNNTSATPGLNYTETFMFEEQVGMKVKFTKDINFKGAVGLTTYSGTRNTTTNNNGQTQTGSYATAPLVESGNGQQPNDFAGPFTGGAAAPISNDYAINNLAVLDAPAELNFKLGCVPMKIFGDFAINLSADARSAAAGNAVKNGTAVTPIAGGATAAALLATSDFKELKQNNSNQDIAYEAGIQAGELKGKGDWQAKAYWMDRDYFSLDPNLTDSDIFDARLNMQGYVVSGSYNITKGLTGTVTYAEASRADKLLATPGDDQDLNINPVDHYRLVQVDLLWKF